MKRIIALVDCDSFFVTCEQAVEPKLKGQPVCVISNNEGCVISRSREAKQMGVKMGMPYFMAKQDYPNAIYIKAEHDRYDWFSKRVMDCLKNFSPDVQIYSIDEAFIDLTGTRKLYGMNYTNICKMIRRTIKEQTDIDVSIGISHSKTLSKLASDKAKNTGGIYTIGAFRIKDELKKTDISEVWGVGRQINKFCLRWGILNAWDFVSRPDAWLKNELGKNGLELKYELLGDCISPVESKKEPPKSIQKTSAIGGFTSDINIIKSEIAKHIHRGCAKLRRWGGKCSTVGVMLRTKDFYVCSRYKELIQPTNFELTVKKAIDELLPQIYSQNVLYRSTGIMLNNLSYSDSEQLFLFDSVSEKDKKLAECIDKIENKFGKNSIKTGFWTDRLKG